MLRHEFGMLSKSIAGAFDLHDDSVMEQSVQQRRGDDGITEYWGMPHRLTGESLKCGWLIRTILFMASAFRSAVDARDAGHG